MLFVGNQVIWLLVSVLCLWMAALKCVDANTNAFVSHKPFANALVVAHRESCVVVERPILLIQVLYRFVNCCRRFEGPGRCNCLPTDTALRTRRLESSASSLWELRILVRYWFLFLIRLWMWRQILVNFSLSNIMTVLAAFRRCTYRRSTPHVTTHLWDFDSRTRLKLRNLASAVW